VGEQPGLGLKNIKFAPDGDAFFVNLVALNGNIVMEAVEAYAGGGVRFVTGALGTRWRFSEPAAWTGDTDNPFSFDNQFAGMYLNGVDGFIILALALRSSLSMALVIDNAVIGMEIYTDLFIQSISARAVLINANDFSQGFIRRGEIAEGLPGEIAAVNVTNNSQLYIGFSSQGLNIDNTEGAGVYGEGMASIITGLLSGLAAEGNVGIAITDMSLLRTSFGDTTIVGRTLGLPDANLAVRVAASDKAYAALPYEEDNSRAQ
jgi:hypothetical protein